MNDFLSGIGFMAIMAAIIYFLVQHDDKKRDKIIENEKMFSHIGGDDDLDNSLPRSKAIEKVLSDLKSPPPEFENADKANIEADFETGVDIESLAGTWGGEPYADKIIILRGGRGFVIFKNGATMNIKITVKKASIAGKNTSLEISQVGKSNASFFPELPREQALACAARAAPITWNFALTSQDTLEGIKNTVIQTNDGTEQTAITSSWTRR